jgi:DNA primase
MRTRPLTLLRYPTGLGGKHFFQKHVEFEPPPFVDRPR